MRAIVWTAEMDASLRAQWDLPRHAVRIGGLSYEAICRRAAVLGLGKRRTHKEIVGERILAAIGKGEMTLRDIADAAGLSHKSVLYSVRKMMAAETLHFCGYAPPGRNHPAKQYAAGPDPELGGGAHSSKEVQVVIMRPAMAGECMRRDRAVEALFGAYRPPRARRSPPRAPAGRDANLACAGR